MRIGFAGPGDFVLGFDSLCRGEGRYLLLLARALSKDPKNEVMIFGQNNPTYQDNKYRIYFMDVRKAEHVTTELNVLFSMGDPFEGCGLESNWITPYVSKIKTKKRIFMSFFGSDNHLASTIPVVYPYYCREVDNVKRFCIPICFGSENDLNKNNFGLANAVWTTKNAHENPDYLYQSLSYALDYVMCRKGKLIMVDGHKLLENEYKDSDKVKDLMKQCKDNIWYQKEWLPYNKMQYVMSKSAFITGVHHPIVGPSQIDIVQNGGIPIIFQNQKELPPYDKTNIPNIEFQFVDEAFSHIYTNILKNKDFYTTMLNVCKTVIAEYYTEEVALREFYRIVEMA